MMLFAWFPLIVLPAICSALLEEAFVSFKAEDGAVPVHDASIIFAADDPVGIKIAATSLAGDLEQITGRRPANFSVESIGTNATSFLDHQAPSVAIITGTVNSALMQWLVDEGHLDVSDIQGKWETFKTSVVRNPLPGVKDALVIAGSDKRGAMFGVYTLAQQCGQSPYHWWADVPATKHSEIYALPKMTVHGEPTIKYRGLFINDEAPSLTGWWSRRHNTSHYPLDSEFYTHVFDMMVRLRANYLWPAMWASAVPKPGNIFFTDDPGNQQLADDYGIVVSTSHHEPMQRATNEWNASETGPWDWTVNKENVTKFMDEGIRRAGHNESYFTLGMRGPNDGPIEADDPIEVLRDVFATERDILAKYYGNRTAANQVWTIYKEVATYYADGLNPPEDVSLIFPDDNWGNVQRLPTGNETERLGGSGVYFHLEYVGVPRSYKWQNNNDMAKIYKELYQTYQRGADHIWVINVADIKPMELPFGFIMDLAWDASKIDFGSIPDYLKAVSEREFGPEHADEISSILLKHNHLTGRRKFESIGPFTYSPINYRESDRVLSEWHDIAARATTVSNSLPEELKAAFYHLVEYPVRSGYIYHAVVLGQGRNHQYATERRNSANQIAQQVLDDFDADFDLEDTYNTMVGGKWYGIMSQNKYDMSIDNWKAPSRDVLANLSYVQLRKNLAYEFGNLGIYAEGSTSAEAQGRICASIDPSMPTEDGWAPVLPSMDPYGPATRTVDIFHRGDHRVPVEWSLDIPYDWVTISPSSGIVSKDQPEQRLNISINWSAVPNDFDETVEIRVNFNTSPTFDLIHLPVYNFEVPSDFHGFPETAGMISIESPHFQRSSDGEDVSFEHIPHLGSRTETGSVALRPYLAARELLSNAKAAWVEYDIYLYNQSTPLNATIYVNGALDTDPNLLMEYSLTLDSTEANFTRLLGDPKTAGDVPPGWRESVADQVWIREISFGNVTEGAHTLRWSVNSPEVYLEKIVLDTRGGVAESYLGPPETAII